MNRRDQLTVSALFIVIGVALLCWFVNFARPPERTHRAPFQQDYSEAPLVAALASNTFEKTITDIAGFGSRMSGSPGFYRTEDYILSQFRAAGLVVTTEEFEVVVPVTQFCEILDAHGQPLPGVQLYPFMPAGLMPVSCTVSGELVSTDSTALKYLTGHEPTNSIVLTYLDAGNGWEGLASVGVPALIVREDEFARALRSSPDAAGNWAGLVATDETAFPRFIARGPIEKYAGTAITIRCRVTWQTKRVRNILGVLRGSQPSAEALVLTSYYDSSSVVPDLAPGGEQSISIAVLLDYVHALTAYRGQLKRDVVFVATAGHGQTLAGADRLMEALETYSQHRADYRSFTDRKRKQEQLLSFAERGVEWPTESGPRRDWFVKAFATVAGEINLTHKEAVLQAQLAYLRAGSPVYRDGFDPTRATDAERKDEQNSHPLLRAYIAAKTVDNQSANLMTLPFPDLQKRPEYTAWNYESHARQYFARLVEFHRQKIRELDDLIATQALFAPYARTLTVNLELYSGGARGSSNLAVLVGIRLAGSLVEPQVTDLANLLTEKTPAGQFKTISWGARDAEGSLEQPCRISPTFTELESAPWFWCGRLAFTVTNYEFFPAKLATPEDTAPPLAGAVLPEQVPVLGRTLLALAFGRVPFKTIPANSRGAVFGVSGTVYGNAGAAAMLSTHPMGTNTFVHILGVDTRTLSELDTRGVRLVPLLPVDPYGHYEANIVFDLNYNKSFDAAAARFDEVGQLRYINDPSLAAQSMYHSDKVSVPTVVATGGHSPQPVNIGLFRCAPIALYNCINPTTLRPFVRVDYLTRAGLSAPASVLPGVFTAFVDPSQRLYLALLDGDPDNPEIQEYRAFMLNENGVGPITPDEPDIFGAGYLAADSARLTLPDIDAAASMVRTSDKRLRLEQRFGMADAQMLSFHQHAQEWLGVAQEKRAQTNLVGAVNAAATALAYAINNHPVIRSRISQAIIGILWYLGLLVPFVFFAEKLIFGFTDIRKQLAAIGIIFLLMFSVLRVFHPAFQIVRSSLMILLGFVILLLTVLVTLMVGGKFKQNIKDLRRNEGRVAGADVNRGGVIGTAFMLGLNNMRRRKVRTGLTCVTLILITFVMICFTSVSSNLTNVEYPTARAAWNGILLRNPNFKGLESSQIQNIQRLYGERFPIATVDWLVPAVNDATGLQNLEVLVDRAYTVAGLQAAKRAHFNSVVRFDWDEPQFSGINKYLLTNRGWFPRPPQTRSEQRAAVRAGAKMRNFVILPDTAAKDLGISVADVNAGGVTVNIRGEEYEVLGIFDSVEVNKCLGLDGQSLLPYDLNSVQAIGNAIPESIGRLTASQVIFVNKFPKPKGNEMATTVTCGILFPKVAYRVTSDAPVQPPVEYKAQRRTVLEYLERTGQSAYYAIDGVAYYGSRQRATTIAGLMELLVPILIAALTVFNTMRGSVYERKGEIFVYNAVGIAPNHVFFMFIAEACVFAVMGAMLGYILSQATGRVLSALHWTGGMNMDYSSIETVYASLAICAAVLLSAILPARDAARLASPSGVVSWDVPVAVGDTMEFNLPFTFTAHDRVAVVSYFHRWLLANGTGSSGAFYCAPPEVLVKPGVVPALASTIWLKPYDLGVSQRLEIALPTDPETGEFVARITLIRQSGHVASWRRTVKPFLTALRQQFLNWRATTADDRTEMFTEAKQLLQETTHV